MAACAPETPPPAYSPPPLYETLADAPFSPVTNRTASLRLRMPVLASKLLTVDFFPESSHVRFPALISRANSWLRANGDWKVQTCESVDLVLEDGEPNTSSVFSEDHFSKSVYVRGLRLWATRKADKNKKPQQIFYKDFVPRRRNSFSNDFQRFDEVLEKLNEDLIMRPLNGKIISVETITTKLDESKNAKEVDSDCTYFKSKTSSLFVLRIFYEDSRRAFETLEIVDFYPKKVFRNGGKVYESIPNLVAQAAEFCKLTSEMEWVGLQTIEMNKIKGELKRVDSSSMVQKNMRFKSAAAKYLRILRLYHTKSCFPPSFLSGCRLLHHITCKTFIPKRLEGRGPSSSEPTFESNQQTLLRISRWVQENNARIVSAETSRLVYRSNKEPLLPSSTYSVKRGPAETYITIFRIYVDGEFPNTPLPTGSGQSGDWFGHATEQQLVAEVADCIFL